MKGFNWVAAVCLVVSVASDATAETARRTMVVEWFHMPRKDVNLVAHQRATLPGATLSYLRWDDGDRMFVFRFDSGIACSSHAEKGDIVRLTCGVGEAYYQLVQRPGVTAHVEHVTNEADKPAAEKSDSESAPKKSKVRL